jgi:hypothetical protein
MALLVLLGSLAACTTFGSGSSSGGDAADAATDTGGDAGGDMDGRSDAPDGGGCWRGGGCALNQICCVAADLSSSCKEQSACPPDHAAFACLRTRDCAIGRCCVTSTVGTDGSVTTYYPTSTCTAVCAPAAGSYEMCDGPSDCDPGTRCQEQPTYVPSNLLLCSP